jgi:hypothetical protein
MLPGSLLDEYLKGGIMKITIAPWKRVPDLAARMLIVQVLLLYLYHTKAMPWFWEATRSASGAGSQPRVYICTLGVCLNHLVTRASLFQSSTSLDANQVVCKKSRIKQLFSKSASSPLFSNVFMHICGSGSVSN